MFCRKCGAEIRLNAKFCAKCGVPVAKTPEPKPEEKRSTPNPPPLESSKTALAETPAAAAAETAPTHEERPKLIIHMPKTTQSRSNGQFNDWFTDGGDL
ncbi:MAG: zinc-ribbon domain-containing protein [Clostridia bacterium]|nr:zinc-ribbon domain-containing protein [Clostridia bacterium]